MSAMASQITSLMIVYSSVYSEADQRKHQNSASLAFVWGIHRWPMNSPHKGPVTRKMFPFDDVIMVSYRSIVASRPIYEYRTRAVNREIDTGNCQITSISFDLKLCPISVAPICMTNWFYPWWPYASIILMPFVFNTICIWVIEGWNRLSIIGRFRNNVILHAYASFNNRDNLN